MNDPTGKLADPVTVGAALCLGGAVVGGYEYYWYHVLTGRKTSFQGYAWSAAGGCVAGIGLAFGITEGAIAAGAATSLAATSALAAPVVQFASNHILDHIPPGVTQSEVEGAINQAIQEAPPAGESWNWIEIAGQWWEYRVYVLPNGTLNVGTAFPVAGPLTNAKP